MPATKYTYSIQTSFPNHRVATDRLLVEIQASPIVTALDHINTSGDDCDVWFKDALAGPDEGALGTLVSQHSGEPLPSTSQLVTLDGVPTTTDGKPQMVPNLLPSWASLYFTGQGDTRQDGLGAGQPFMVSSEASGDTVVEWIFTDQIFLVGGTVIFNSSELGDHMDYVVVAPATPTGVGATKVTLVPYNGGHVIVPDPSGASTIDLTNVGLVPTGGAGYWDWDAPTQGYGTITPNYTGKGNYTLFDFEVTLGHPMVSMHILGNGKLDFMMPNITPMRVMPQWKHRAIVHNSGHTGLKLAWLIVGGRGGAI